MKGGIASGPPRTLIKSSPLARSLTLSIKRLLICWNSTLLAKGTNETKLSVMGSAAFASPPTTGIMMNVTVNIKATIGPKNLFIFM